MNKLLKILQEKADLEKIDLQELLRLYALEMLLSRLTHLPASKELIVRGSLITRFWAYPKHFRAVQDLDFVLDEPLNEIKGNKIIQDILKIEMDDLLKPLGGFQVTKIWEETDLPALRFEIPVEVCTHTFQLQLDMAFNDPIVPPAVFREYTDLCGHKIWIRTILPELACAWKIHGLFEYWNKGNRWQAKTLYDIFLLLDTQDVNKDLLKQAIQVAFEDRKTPFEVYKRILNGQFGQSKGTKKAWEKWRLSYGGKIPYLDYQPLLLKIRDFLDEIFIQLIAESQ